MTAFLAIFRREIASYFQTPIALVFIIVFLLANGFCVFYLGGFMEREEADLAVFFAFHPWLYLIFIPAVAMRLFAEERAGGTLELLLSLPLSPYHIVLGKFFAAWLFTLLALILTTPIWMTVSYLGDPDHGVILAGYLGSALMAGAYLSIALSVSVLTKNQVIAFIGAALLCFLLSAGGSEALRGILSPMAHESLLQILASSSFLTHFEAILKGVLNPSDLLFFLSHILFWLVAATLFVDLIRRSA